MSIDADIQRRAHAGPAFTFPPGEASAGTRGLAVPRARRTLSTAGRLRALLRMLSALTKVNISLLSMLSAAAGYFLAAGGLHVELIWALAGTFILACGSAALNEVQEWRFDALMERTKRRPIPLGKLRPAAGLLIAVGLAAAGAVVLFAGAGLEASLLGLAALVSYNVIYTPLKRVTAFAVIPGSIIGAIPPAIGWVAAGGSLGDPRILALSFFFFVWQVPHFWLLLLKYGPDYERAGFPVLTSLFSVRQLARLTFVWIVATAGAALLLPLFRSVTSSVPIAVLLAASLWLCWKARGLLKVRAEDFSPWPAFMQINLFALVIMILVSVDAFIR